MAWNDGVLRALRDGAIIQEGTRTGKLYNASRRITGVAAGANVDSIFTTGALPVYLFMRDVGRSGLGVSASIYRAPTYTGGTLDPVYSVNDITGDGSLSTIQLRISPTVTVVGTQTVATSFAIGNTSNQGQGGIAELKQPLYMLPNTAYLLRITSLDSQAQDITANIAWYEGNL